MATINNSIFHTWYRLLEWMKRAGAGYEYQMWEQLHSHAGLAFMRRFRQYYPAVREISCNDDHATGSRLFLVPMESGDEYYKTIMIFVPQYGSRNLMMFSSLDELIEELRVLQARQQAKTKEDE